MKRQFGLSSFKVSEVTAFIVVFISIIINYQVGKKCKIGKGPRSKKHESLRRACLLSLSNVYTAYTCIT